MSALITKKLHRKELVALESKHNKGAANAQQKCTQHKSTGQQAWALCQSQNIEHKSEMGRHMIEHKQ